MVTKIISGERLVFPYGMIFDKINEIIEHINFQEREKQLTTEELTHITPQTYEKSYYLLKDRIKKEIAIIELYNNNRTHLSKAEVITILSQLAY